MKFFNRKISKKLLKIGCISKSGFTYPAECNGSPPMYTYNCRDGDTPAFTLLDFIDTNEQAIENCKNLFGKELTDYEVRTGPLCGAYSDYEIACKEKWDLERHNIIDSPDGIDYITKAVGKNNKEE